MTGPAPLTTAELAGLRDELIRARARGTRTVSYDGKTVTYTTDSEMAAALADIERRLRRAERGPVNSIRIASSKGV